MDKTTDSAIRVAIITGIFLIIGAFITGYFTSQPTTVVVLSVSNTPVPPSTAILNSTQAAAGVTRNADWASVEQVFGGVTMVLVPAGCFQMGVDEVTIEGLKSLYPSVPAEYFEASGPAHTTCIDTPFWLDKTEVTQAQFANNGGVKANPNRFIGDNRPVERITWFEARDYCAAQGGRLPTETEWEFAARGPDGRIYPWGNTLVGSNTVYGENSGDQTAVVGSRPAGMSWVGAHDMTGNVWEWTNTVYGIDDGDYNYNETGERRILYPYDADDGREIDSNDATYHRVLRGGSWNSYGSNLWAADRAVSLPNGENNGLGFRCARSQ